MGAMLLNQFICTARAVQNSDGRLAQLVRRAHPPAIFKSWVRVRVRVRLRARVRVRVRGSIRFE